MKKPESPKDWEEYILKNFGIKAEVYNSADHIWYARFELLDSLFQVAKLMERWGYEMNITISKKKYKLMVFIK